MRVDHCEIIEVESKTRNELRIRYFGKDKKVDNYTHIITSGSPIYHLLLSLTEVEKHTTFRPVEKDSHQSFLNQKPEEDWINLTVERRQVIFQRDGYKCLACETTANLTIDHIIPKAQDGDNTKDNLQTLCKSCNQTKGNRIRDYRPRK